MKPIISIIILNYNGRKDVLTLLKNLKKLSNYPQCEVIVADNASTDGSIEAFKKYDSTIKIAHNKKNLFTGGYNVALKQCKGKYVFFTGNDVTVEKDCLEILQKEIEKSDTILQTYPALMEYEHKNKVNIFGTYASRSFYVGLFRKKWTKKNVVSPFMGTGLLRKSFIDTYGYIFEGSYFAFSEDLDLGLRIRMRGGTTVFVPKAVGYHRGSTTVSSSKDRSKWIFLMEKNAFLTLFRVCSLPRMMLFYPYAVLVRIVVIAKELVKGDFKHALARLKGILWPIGNIPTIVKKRKEVQKKRLRNDAYVFAACSEKVFWKNILGLK